MSSQNEEPRPIVIGFSGYDALTYTHKLCVVGITGSRYVGTVSLPIKSGILADGSITVGLTQTNHIPFHHYMDRNIPNHEHSGQMTQTHADAKGLILAQPEKTKSYDTSVMLNKPIPVGELNTLDLSAKVNITKAPAVNGRKTPLGVSGELVAAYDMKSEGNRVDLHLRPFVGGSVGHYTGAMAGAEISLGTAGTGFPVSTEAVRYGGAAITHASYSGPTPEKGAFKAALYAKTYLSGGYDSRAAYVQPTIAYEGSRFGDKFLGNAAIQGVNSPNGNNSGANLMPQYNSVVYRDQLTPSLKASKFNWEAGVEWRYKLTNAIDLGARAGLVSNPLRDPSSQAYGDLDKINAFLAKQSDVMGVTPTDPRITAAPGQTQVFYSHAPQPLTDAFEIPTPPRKMFGGEVKVNISLGSNTSNNQRCPRNVY